MPKSWDCQSWPVSYRPSNNRPPRAVVETTANCVLVVMLDEHNLLTFASPMLLPSVSIKSLRELKENDKLSSSETTNETEKDGLAIIQTSESRKVGASTPLPPVQLIPATISIEACVSSRILSLRLRKVNCPRET